MTIPASEIEKDPLFISIKTILVSVLSVYTNTAKTDDELKIGFESAFAQVNDFLGSLARIGVLSDFAVTRNDAATNPYEIINIVISFNTDESALIYIPIKMNIKGV